MSSRAEEATILIVDDEPVVCNVIEKVLSRHSYHAICATDALEALEVLRTDEKIDLLISDIHMPDKSGIGLLQEALQLRPDMPVVLMTGDAGMDQYLDVMNKGASQYLSKPFQISDLIRSVQTALASPSAS